ncbi:hypothetical protein BGX26_001087 [Mortierella sp. AD094]|nr:hypothetical protein BGX26_001087 [Mortierella sp. AD094]
MTGSGSGTGTGTGPGPGPGVGPGTLTVTALGIEGRPRSSSNTKALLTMALLEAQSAVQMDNDGDISGALESYTKAVQLLGKVMEATHATEERERLKIIVGGEGSATADGTKMETTAHAEGGPIASGTQDLPLPLQQAQQPSPPTRAALPPIPMSPPPIPPRSPPPNPPRSPPPQSSRSPTPLSRAILSPTLGPQLQRKSSLTKKNFNSYSTAQAQAQAVQQFVSSTLSTTDSTAPTSDATSVTIASKDAPPMRAKKTVSHGPLTPILPPSTDPPTATRRPRAESVPIAGSTPLNTVTEGTIESVTSPTSPGSGLSRPRHRVGTRSTGVMPRNTSNDLAPVPENMAFHPPPPLHQQRRIREKDPMPKVVILQTAPTTPLPPPPPQPAGVTSEPLRSNGSSEQESDLGTVVSAPASVLSPLLPSALDAVDSTLDPPASAIAPPPPIPARPPRSPPVAPMRPSRSGAASPTPKLKRSGAPSLTGAHMSFSALSDTRPLSPPPISPLPQLPPKFSSPPLSPISPQRRMRPMHQSVDMQAIPSLDQSLHSQAQHQDTNKQERREESNQGLKPELKGVKEEEQTSESSSSHRTSHSSTSSMEKDQESVSADRKRSSGGTLVQEWLPNLLNKSFATSEIFLDHLEHPQDPMPQDVFLKGWYNHSQNGESIPPVPPLPPMSGTLFTPPLSPMADSENQPSLASVLKRSSLPTPSNDSQQSLSSGISQDSLEQMKRHILTGNNESQASFSSSSSTTSSVRRQQQSAPVGTADVNNMVNTMDAANKKMSLEPTSPTMKPSRTGKFSKLTNAYHNSNFGGAQRELSLQEVISQDPFAGMKPPNPPKELDPPPPADPYLRCFWFMHMLEQTMTTGGFLSPKLYVPRNIWYQKTSIRLPAVEAKILACQGLCQLLDQMVAQSKAGKLTLLVEVGGNVEKGERDRNELLKELESLENLTLDLWAKLSKKMSFLQKPGDANSGSGSGVGGYSAKSQSSSSSSSANRAAFHSQNLFYHPLPLNHTNPSNRPSQHYQNQNNDHHNPYDDHSTSSSDPYSWLGSDDPISASLSSGVISTGSLSSGALSTGGQNSSMLSSTITSNTLSDKGVSSSGNHKRGTSDLMSHWKALSKSVQKTIVTDKIEDTTNYTEALIRLFRSSYILESMIKHFEALPPHQTIIKILGRLQRICDFYNLVVCAFVIRDVGDLMAKYVKRMGAMVAE